MAVDLKTREITSSTATILERSRKPKILYMTFAHHPFLHLCQKIHTGPVHICGRAKPDPLVVAHMVSTVRTNRRPDCAPGPNIKQSEAGTHCTKLEQDEARAPCPRRARQSRQTPTKHNALRVGESPRELKGPQFERHATKILADTLIET